MESAVQKNTTTSGRPAEQGDRVLCLDGGGMRGLIHTTILKKLEHDLGINPDDASGPRLRDYFDWICGTSTGALLAGLLATGKTAQDGELLYQRFREGCNTGSTKERSSALRKALLNEFGEELKMTELTGWRSEKLKVIVTGVLADRLPTKLHLFRSYETDKNDYDSDHHQFAPTTPPHKQPVWEALLASAAAPYYFLPCGNFIDGGLMANNPTLDVLAEINEYNQARGRNFIDNRPIDVVLSLGTGVPRIEKEELPVFHLQESTFQKLTSPVQNVANLKSLIRLGEINLSQATQTTRQAVHRCKNWCNMIGASFYRFSPKLDTAIPLDCKDQKILEMMMKHSEQYIYSHRESINDLVRKLRR